MIFFDAAGTIIRLGRPVGETYAEVARHYGASVSAEEAERGFRQAWQDLGRAGGRFARAWWREVVWRSLPAEVREAPFPFEDYFEEVFEVFARPEVWRVYPEVEGVLARLEEMGVRRAVLSNWDGRLRRILEGLELAQWFEWIGVSEELGAAKPDEAVFRAAEAAVGVDGGRIWLVGDDREADVGGAMRAGWTGRLVLRPDIDLELALGEVWEGSKS
ncbi:MAG: HAD-IA family hydrolase [Verrucomicrobiia bacterium]